MVDRCCFKVVKLKQQMVLFYHFFSSALSQTSADQQMHPKTENQSFYSKVNQAKLMKNFSHTNLVYEVLNMVSFGIYHFSWPVFKHFA